MEKRHAAAYLLFAPQVLLFVIPWICG